MHERTSIQFFRFGLESGVSIPGIYIYFFWGYASEEPCTTCHKKTAALLVPPLIRYTHRKVIHIHKETRGWK